MPFRTTYRNIVAMLSIVHGFAWMAPAQPPPSATHTGFTFMPQGLLFQPLTSSYHEPRVGLRKQVGSSKMKLDIGSSLDFLEYRFSEDKVARMGVDFFTYALTTSSQGLRLQIDAVDGFFGGHAVVSSVNDVSRWDLRLRILHVSAHFIDGHYDNATMQWKDGREPIPFTRDFGEITAAFSWRVHDVTFMAYSGISYATLVRPTDVRRVATLHGLELRSSELLGPALGRPVNLFVADNVTLVGVPSYIGTNNLEFGVKFGEWNSTGLRLYGSYYSGLDVFSQYFNVRRENWGVGFAFDFW